MCVWEKPQNPNMLYIGCEGEACDKWVHPVWVGIKDTEADSATYYWKPCKKKRKRDKKNGKTKNKKDDFKKFREHF